MSIINLITPELISALGQMFTALTSLLAAIAAICSILQSRKNAGNIIKNTEKIEAVHLATNSRMDDLLQQTRESSDAKGYKRSQDEFKANGKG